MIVVIIAWISFVGLALAAASWWFDFGDLVDVLPNGETFPLLEGALVRPELDRVVVRPLAALLGIAMVGFFVGSGVALSVLRFGRSTSSAGLTV